MRKLSESKFSDYTLFEIEGKIYRVHNANKTIDLLDASIPDWIEDSEITLSELDGGVKLATQNVGTLPWELNLANQPDPILRACGVLPAFGLGHHLTFTASATVIVPAGVTKMRFLATGGGGDIYGHGATVSVGTFGTATGGRGNINGYSNVGGDGTGGDVTAKGGTGCSGGGAAGSQLGDGGHGQHGTSVYGGSGGAVGINTLSQYHLLNSSFLSHIGQSPFSSHPNLNYDVFGNDPANGNYQYPKILCKFMGHSFSGAGANENYQAGTGAGGGKGNPNGGIGGGGKGATNTDTEIGKGGENGGGSGGNLATAQQGGGGGGFVMGMIVVVPGQEIPITIGAFTALGGCPSVTIEY